MGHGQIVDSQATEEQWRWILLHQSEIRARRRLWSRIPSAPRCKLCTRPFGGLGGRLMTALGYGRWSKNANYCTGCFATLRRAHGGAEIECSLLFADVRGSTSLAERMRPREFNRLMGRLYDTATEVLVDHDAIVDKFVGDEVVAIFVPSLAGEEHARQAIEAATELLRRTGYGSTGEPWIPIGVGVNTGEAYVGSVGEGPDTELTAMGDAVNTTARLSSVANAGEILVTMTAAAAAGLSSSNVERRSLTLKGKSEPTEVLVLHAQGETNH